MIGNLGVGLGMLGERITIPAVLLIVGSLIIVLLMDMLATLLGPGMELQLAFRTTPGRQWLASLTGLDIELRTSTQSSQLIPNNLLAARDNQHQTHFLHGEWRISSMNYPMAIGANDSQVLISGYSQLLLIGQWD